MNRHFYRIVFNRARMLPIAVAEITTAHGQNGGRGSICGNPSPTHAIPGVALHAMTFAIGLALGLIVVVPVHAAGIIADPSAPGNQHPTVLNVGNGIPQVNIQTPNAAGVSRNTYSQFDVSSQGAILNNARTNAQTQLGGWIQGNPWLAGGTARVILNEVNSSNPSLLNGYIEVAGSRAQVVIANPAGISCTGCGFINANRATLTTGSPVMHGGSLDAYLVRGGTVSISSNGLDASGTDYADIIARAVQVNAGIWANDLRITAGANQVDAAHTQATPATGRGSAPAFAVDVAALGGMYAGKITLTGTEAGVGVRNAGHLGATAGNFIVTVDGRLQNSGSITASGNASLAVSGAIDNSGTLYALGNTTLDTQSNLDNSGVVAALGDTVIHANGTASVINSTATSVMAAGLKADGTLGGNGDLAATATQSILAHGQNLAAGDQILTAQTLDLAGSQTVGRNLTFSASNGNLHAVGSTVTASGTLTAGTTQTLVTDSATVSADQVNLAAHDLHNIAGEIVQTGSSDATIALAGHLDNTRGRIATNSANLRLAANQLSNANGRIEHAGNGELAIQAPTLDGTYGQILSNGGLALTATTATLDQGSMVANRITIDTATLSNRGGQITQTGSSTTDIHASSQLDNTGGAIAGNGDATLAVGNLVNRGGNIQAIGDSSLTVHATGTIDNSAAGTLQSGGAALLSSASLDNASGQITAGQSLHVTTTQGIDNRNGLLASNQAVDLTASSIGNSGGTIASVQAGVDLNAASGALDNTGGKITAAQTLATASLGLDNTDGILLGHSVTIDSKVQSFNNTRGTVIAATVLDVQSGRLANDAGLLQSNAKLEIDTHGQTLANTNSGDTGGILSQADMELSAGDLSNQSGYIGAKGAITANGSTIDNRSGTVTTASTLAFTGTALDNQAGRVEALGNVNIATADRIDNRQGLLRSGSALTLSAGSLDNRNTQGGDEGIEGRDVSITADRIDNHAGAIRADRTLAVTSSRMLDNTQGLVSSAHTLSIADRIAAPGSNVSGKTLDIANTGGTLIAGHRLDIDSHSLDGDGKVLSQGDLGAKLAGDNTLQGEWHANGNATFANSGVLANQAKLLAGNALGIEAGGIDNQSGGEISAAALHLAAAGTLANRGLINGGDTFIDAAHLDNLGTGRIYGDHVAIGADTLANDIDNGIAAVIAARNRLDIGATAIANRDHALIFSAGDMHLGGSLDANRQAVSQAAVLDNSSATIEALGNLDISSVLLHNTNAHFTIGVSSVSTTFAGFDMGKWCSSLYAMPGCTGHFREDWTEHTYTRIMDTPVVAQSDPAQILASGNIALRGNALVNDKSRILAGGTLGGDLGNLSNIGAEGTQVDSLVDQYLVYKKHEGYIDAGTHVITTTSTVTLPVSEVRSGTAPTGTGTQVGPLAIGSVTPPASGAGDARAAIGTGQVRNIITQVAAVGDIGASGPDTVIRTANPNTTVGNHGLYRPHPDPSGHYLIETDPAFANYRNWLSSDFMLAQLGVDAALTQKRLGDGFYEQKLVREQVAQLTGRRFLAGYSDDEAEFRALMTNGATFAQNHQLVPGVALTEAQMAQLTSDIVWLVEKPVTLPDGRLTHALVPQVYVRLRPGDLDGSGALLAGDSVKLNLSGDLANSGTIAGRSVVALTADNIRNLNGRIAGNNTALTARTDLDNLGGRIEGSDRLSVAAARNLTVETTMTTADNVTANSRFSRTTVDRVAGLYVTNPSGTLIASAGNDMNLIAAVIGKLPDAQTNPASGSVAPSTSTLTAGRDLKLGTVTTAQLNQADYGKGNAGRISSTQEIGSSINTQGDLTLVANRDLTARAANVTSTQGAITAVAGNNLTIETGTATRDEEATHASKKRGFLSSRSKQSRDTLNETTAITSTFSGDGVNLDAGRDLSVKGSNVVGTNNVTLAAGDNVSIETTRQTHDETHAARESKSGVFGSGNGITVGSKKLATTNDTQTVTNLASTVGSINGDVTISAGNPSSGSGQGQYTQTGSNVLAPKGDIDITAQKVDINAATDTYANQQTMKFKQSGLSVGLSSGIISTVQNTLQETKITGNSGDDRVRQLANSVMTLDDASNIKSNIIGMQQGYAKDGIAGAAKASGMSLNISLGSSKASSSSTTSVAMAKTSTVAAGGDVNIFATGAGKNSDLTVQGSDIKAGNNATLKADDEIKLIAAQNTLTEQSSNKSSSSSIGASVGISANGVGVGINASASRARGNADGQDTTNINSHIDAANKLTLESGGDTTLKGAVATGKQVTASIGGNLNLESLQDTSTYKSKQQSVGVGVSVPIVGGGAAGGYLSASKANAKDDYASVVEQTGIKAGDKGFNITSQGNTDLKGAIIASTEKAVQDDKNSLTTGTLTYSNILNHTEASASSNGINLTQDLFSKYGAVRTALSTTYQNINESERRSGVTQSAIKQGTLNITAQNPPVKNISEDNAMIISRDTQNANQPVIKLDAKAMEQQVAREAQLRAADVALITRVTDDTYRVMFRETPKFYKAVCPASADCVANPKQVQVEPVTGTPEEIQAKITQNGDANAVLAVNGIQNGIERGVELAFQNAAMVKTDANGQPLPNGGQDKPQTIYLMHYQPANSTVGEMIVAGYEKLLTQIDSGTANFLGYTNPDTTYAQTLQGFGNNAVNSLGHSRGTEVQTNAFNILGQQGYTNDKLTVRGVGGAVGVQEYTDAAMGVIGNPANKGNITFNYYTNDPVATLAGGNPGNSSVMALRDLWTVLTGGDNTQHSCYGTGAAGCAQVEIPTATGPKGTNDNLIQYQGGNRIDSNPVGR